VTVLAVGLSHRTAPVSVLADVALAEDDVAKLLADLLGAPHVAEALVASTCNRVEVYADVDKFHGGVADVSELLARTGGMPLERLSPYLYVHYDDRAVQHLFAVAAGLDSMVVGESQILGQVRSALRAAREADAVGRTLGPLLEQALRTGKRVHAETGIDRAGASVMSAGLDAVGDLTGRHALVVGAGAMGALAVSLLRRRGVADLVVANRSVERAARLAAAVGARATGLDRLTEEIAVADVVVASTGAAGLVVPAASVAAALAARRRPLALVDVALPRDVDPGVRRIPGVTLVDLETLRETVGAVAAAADVEVARRIVTEEVGAFLAWRRAAQVAPTVVALRAKAADVVAAELSRLHARLPSLPEREREEVGATVRRVVDKLLHAPTVRVKELADAPEGPAYEEALRELFGLDPAAAEVVTRADVAVDEVALP
jgi:glutamyl-tRNA reductase